MKTNLSQIKYKMEISPTYCAIVILFRTIGTKLTEIEGRMPKLNQHLTELETDYRRVSAYFDDILTEHEKTFMSVRRSTEQSEERKVSELEMRMSRPVAKYQRQTSPTSYIPRNRHSFERSELNPELPLYVSDKYRSDH